MAFGLNSDDLSDYVKKDGEEEAVLSARTEWEKGLGSQIQDMLHASQIPSHFLTCILSGTSHPIV